MDSNKAEAEKAKELAEAKMKTGDFIEAHTFLTKAQRLFPDLEDIAKLIAICDVHSAHSHKKISGLENYYAILQVQPSAEYDTIKKQFRKLALLLHPDKNTFVGAEAAFKMVVQAHKLLSHSEKRSQYDRRYRSHSMMMASKKANATKQCQDGVDMFWSSCRYCSHRFQCAKECMNKIIVCSICSRSYIAIDIIGKNVSNGDEMDQETEERDETTKKRKSSEDGKGDGVISPPKKKTKPCFGSESDSNTKVKKTEETCEEEDTVSPSKISKAENGCKPNETEFNEFNVVDMELDSEILKSKVDGSKVEVKVKHVRKTNPPRKVRKSYIHSSRWDLSSRLVDENKTLNGSRKNDEATDVFKPGKSASRLQTFPNKQGDEKKSVKRIRKSPRLSKF